MRNLNLEQENLCKQFKNIGVKFADNKSNYQCESSVFDKPWQLIMQRGIFKYPIKKQYGGFNLSWDSCISAISSIVSGYTTTSYITSLVTQLSALFLISVYGSDEQKTKYLPKLINGQLAYIYHIGFDYGFHDNKLRSLRTRKDKIANTKNDCLIDNCKIIICIKHRVYHDNNIEFFILDENNDKLHVEILRDILKSNKDMNSSDFFNDENKLGGPTIFINKDQKISILYEFISFKRLIYALFSIETGLHATKKHEYILRKSSLNISNQLFNDLENNLSRSRERIYSMLVKFLSKVNFKTL